jgi:hypothetical protein
MRSLESMTLRSANPALELAVQTDGAFALSLSVSMSHAQRMDFSP